MRWMLLLCIIMFIYALHSLLTSSFAAGTPVHHIIPSTYISWAIILILCLVDVSCLLLNTDPSYTISFAAEIDVSCLLLNTDPSYTMSFAFLPACCFTCKHQLWMLACLPACCFIHTHYNPKILWNILCVCLCSHESNLWIFFAYSFSLVGCG